MSSAIAIVIFCFTCCITGSISLSDFERYTDPARDGFKSVATIHKPTCKTFDRFGNIILNGRVTTENEHFEVESIYKPESELSVVFCLQNRRNGCVGNGLVLCYPHQPFTELYPTTLNEQQQYLKSKCAPKNGIAVSTEHDGKINQFRIDTVFGNTYAFPIPHSGCFALWLLYDDVSSYNSMVATEEAAHLLSNYHIQAVSFSTDDSNLNDTETPPQFTPKRKHVMLSAEKRPIRMLWKEVMTWPKVEGMYSTVSFGASGGGPCCAITARITGKYVTKCYDKWVQIGEECKTQQPGETRECDFPYLFDRRNTTKTSRSNTSFVGLTQGEKQKLYQSMANNKDDYDLLNITSHGANETLLNIGDVTKGGEDEDLNFGIYGRFTVAGYFDVDPLKINLTITADGGYNKTGFKDNDNDDVGNFETKEGHRSGNEKYNASKTNTINESQNKNESDISISRSGNSSTEFLNFIHRDKNESHAVRNIIHWPDVVRFAELRRICRSEEWSLNMTTFFSNNADQMKLVYEREKEKGHADISVYESCPIFDI